MGISLLLSLWRIKTKAKKYKRDHSGFFLDDRFRMIMRQASKLLYLRRVKVKCQGFNGLPSTPVIYVVNHKSNLDSVALLKAIRNYEQLSKLCFVAKKEIQKSQLISSALDIIDTIFIDRDNPRAVFEAYEKQIQAVNEGRSIVVFIEGHRYFMDQLGEFKAAALKIAYKTYKPIVPIVIYGSSGLMDKNKDNLNKKRTIHIHALNIMKHNAYATSKEEYAAQYLKGIMQEKYNEMKQLDIKNELNTLEE